MTIAAAYLVSEGIVLGADSSTTVQVAGGVIQLLAHSQKVFEVGTNSRLGVCTWGSGSLGQISHRTVIAQLAEQVNDKTTVEEAANELVKIVEPLIKQIQIPLRVGYYLGGWNPIRHDPSCFLIEMSQQEKKVTPIQLGLCTFSGNHIFFGRVFRGFDQRLQENLKNELKKDIKIDNFDAVFDKAFNKSTEGLASVGFQDLPIREAIDFVYSYLHITVKAEKFKFGAPSCGGPIEVGFISTDRPFRWVRHKPFYSAIAEQEGEEYESK